MARSRGRGRRPVSVRRSRRLASGGMILRSGRRVGGVRKRGWLATASAMAGAAARGVSWLNRSQLGKRAASAAAGIGAGLGQRMVRRRFGPTVVKSKQEEDNGAGASAQYDKYAFKWGKKKSVVSLLNKLNTKNACYKIVRFGGTNRFTGSSGAFQLAFATTGTPNVNNLPIHLVDITGFDNLAGGTGYTVTNNAPGHQLQINGPLDSRIQRVDLSGVTNSGAGTTTSYSVLKSNNSEFVSPTIGSTTNIPSGHILEWSSIKLLFRCPRTRPGWFKVSLVQFTEDALCPSEFGLASSIPSSTPFWQRRLKSLIYNPIAHEITGVGNVKHSGMKILKTWVRRWNPDTSTNLATYNGEQIRMDLFIRHNRFVNPRQTGGQYQRDPLLVDDDAYIEEGQGGATLGESNPIVYNTNQRIGGRVYLLIEGTNFDAPAGFDPAIHLSYDMEVRNKLVFNKDRI